MELLDERPPELMSEHELLLALDHNHADLARQETYRLRLVAALDKTGHAERVGARDTVQFIEYRYRLDHQRARRDVALANALPKYAAVSAALPVDGPLEDSQAEVMLRPAQAEAIVLELEKAPSTVPVADLECAEQELVRLARYLPPAELRKAAVQARDILDTDGPEPEEQKASARESLTLTNADRGVKFRGYLANENAELLRALIVAGARPRKTLEGDPDPRSREKRQADALSTALTLAATALDAGVSSPTIPRPTAPKSANENTAAGSGDSAGHSAAPGTGEGAGTGANNHRAGDDVVPGFGAKANITVTIDLQDLKAATADAIGQTVYNSGLSAAAIRRLACDAKVIPVVLGSTSEPLDVGRAERLVTKGIRRALNTRDRGCVVCGAPPVMCDAHHLISWIDGGETKVSNLVLLCRRHHTDLHAGHWRITILDGVVNVARPGWADPPSPRVFRPPARADAPQPPVEDPSCPDPPLVHRPRRSARAPEPSTRGFARAHRPGDALASTATPDPRTARRTPEPWGGTPMPAASASGLRPSRWKSDDVTLAEAARFAVWGPNTTTEADVPPPFATL
ncbi:DUF222 domain-containing protein [Kribbella sp. NPDC051586]|uniref:HNH endonuclease n=1 Tax=Kribbella sp. NPDC051586 TaxID=3364118 RepID=UPI00379BB214